MADLRALVDVDDLFQEEQITEHLVPLRNAVPTLRVTAYAIPNKLGSVATLRGRYPWITFGIHGFEHTPFECRAWTQTHAEDLIAQALSMGYNAIFKPPNWIFDVETEVACRNLGVVLHHHARDLPVTAGLRHYSGAQSAPHAYIHTHITENPATDFIKYHPGFRVESLQNFDGFVDPQDLAEEI